MSSNRTYYCRYCEKRIEGWIEQQYGKISQKEYEKLKAIDQVDELLEFLPEDFKQGETDRIGGCDLDYEFFEDWGEGVEINEDGNLEIDISGTCDLCGSEFQYIIIVPPNSDSPQKVIDLTKKTGKE